MNQREKQAILDVLDSGVLSDYLASWGDKFLGGPQVQALEREWSEYFNVKHSVAMNSATSGLYAAMGAIGIKPGDEVIVSPYSMVASATAPLIYGGIPVFADIDPDTFCITAETIEENITERTKAVIVVDLFGHPAEYDDIMALAETYGLYVIEDAAQAAGATYNGRYAGTLGHIGVYSLNYHKIIHTGEGGVAVTDDDDIALRLQLIRNHAEACTADLGKHQDLYGFNYRLTEIQAALARVKLDDLEALIDERNKRAYSLTRLCDKLGIWHQKTPEHIRSAWYVYPIKRQGWDIEALVMRLWYDQLRLVPGYVKPIYLEPLFKKYAAAGTCPVAERMHFDELAYIKFPYW